MRDLIKVMVPEVGIGGQVSVFDDFLDVINEKILLQKVIRV